MSDYDGPTWATTWWWLLLMLVATALAVAVGVRVVVWGLKAL